MEMNARIDGRFGLAQGAADLPFVLRREDVDVDLLALRQELRQAGPETGNFLERIGETDAFGPRPSQPRCSCRSHSAGMRKPSERGVASPTGDAVMARARV